MTELRVNNHNFDLEDRTPEFAKRVLHCCKQLPHTVINKELISHRIRSSGSAGANDREANDSLMRAKKNLFFYNR